MDFDRSDWRSDTPQDPERRFLGVAAMAYSVVCAVLIVGLVLGVWLYGR